MRKILFLPVLFTAAVASFGSANAQGFFIDDPYVAGPIVTAPGPIVVPAAPVVSSGLVVIHRAPVVAAPVWVPRAPIVAAEPVVVAPPVCPYGYGYC